jgi:hypothetical protein
MAFVLPSYKSPDLSLAPFKSSPKVVFKPVMTPGVAPDDYHATSVYPEYFHLGAAEWRLLEESRMDCVVVRTQDDRLRVTEFRNLTPGDQVACGRRENGEDGIYVHTEAFDFPPHVKEKFAFRSHLTRETSFSIDYDELYDLLDHERERGFILWVLGPAVVFDHDSRQAFGKLIDNGFVHGLMAGNALATHDIEAAIYDTGLGQNIYTQQLQPMGHYNHLDILNEVRQAGSIAAAISSLGIKDGIMYACEKKAIPYVLAGSIRDDGPLPETVGNVYHSQDLMRDHARRATTVITMATQLHSIAFGNMTPGYKVLADGSVRPVYFYVVDMSEFSADKLANRGSAQAQAILTNVQDFIVNLWNNLSRG